MNYVSTVGGAIQFILVSVMTLFFVLYASELGASTAVIGFLVMLKAVLPLALSLPAGGLIDRIGAVTVLKLGCVSSVIGFALLAWSPNLLVLAGTQMVLGFTIMLIASAQQVIVAQGEKADRDRRITSYSAWSSAGNIVGPLMGGAIASGVNGVWETESSIPGYRAAFLFCLALVAVYTVFVYFFCRPATAASPSRRAASRPGVSYRDSIALLSNRGVQYGLMGTFFIHFVQSIWTSFLPLYLTGLGYSAFALSLLVSLRGVAALVSRVFIPHLLRWSKQERVLFTAACFTALCLIALPVFHTLPVVVIMITVILGFASGIKMPVSTIIMVDRTEEGDRGKVMGLRLFVNRLSQVVAPALFGVVGGVIGLGAAFVSGGTLLLITMLGFGVYARRRPGGAL